MDADQLALRDRIYDVLVAVDANGDRLFDEDAIAHLQPLFVLQSLQQGVQLDDENKMVLLALAVNAGIDDDEPDSSFHAKIAAYYDENPVDARLAAAIARALTGADAGAQPTKSVLAAVLGTPASVSPGSAPATGDARARGVLARALFHETHPSDGADKD